MQISTYVDINIDEINKRQLNMVFEAEDLEIRN